VVVPTTDVAERTFTDLTYYLGERAAETVALLRPRDETLGALESPSERSARMTLLADMCARKPQVIVAPVAALRQYVMPRRVFEDASFRLRRGETADWDATLARLYRLGYARVDVVSAAGEYAVRGGILDVFPATADLPVRIEFFGDEVDAIRRFEVQSQRSTEPLDAVQIAPWLEILRDESLRTSVLARAHGEPNVVSRCAPISPAAPTSPNRGWGWPTTSARRCSIICTPSRWSCSKSPGCWKRSSTGSTRNARAARKH